MKNTIISTIKYGAVISAGFLFSVQTSFAALVLTPATATAVSDSSATLVAKVSNAGRNNATVWFEWGATSNLENPIVGMRDIYNEGYPQGYLTELKPGNTYYFRAVAMLGDEKVTSPIATFMTDGGAAPVVVTTIEVPTVTIKGTASMAQPDKTDAAYSSAASMETAAKEAKVITETTKAVAVPNETVATPSVSATNAASVLGVGNGIFPTTLAGWILLLIVILVAVILMHMIYESNGNRKKALEQAKMKMVPAAA